MKFENGNEEARTRNKESKLGSLSQGCSHGLLLQNDLEVPGTYQVRRGGISTRYELLLYSLLRS